MRNDDDFPVIKLEDALKCSSVPEFMRNFISDFLTNTFADEPNSKVYLTKVRDEKIFVIRYTVSDTKYPVNLLIYLPILYPNYEPEIFLENPGRMGITQEYRDQRISLLNLRIDLESFNPFNQIENNLMEIITIISKDFHKICPYDPDSNEQSYITGKCKLDKNVTSRVSIQKKIPMAKFFSNVDNNTKTTKTDSNTRDSKPSNAISDSEFLNIIRKQVKDVVKEKYHTILEKCNILENEKKLTNINKEMKEKLENNRVDNSLKQNEGARDILKWTRDKLKEIEKKLLDESKQRELNADINMLEKCNDLIQIKNERDFEYAIMMKADEQYLAFLKKAFEKKMVPLCDMINMTRNYSREIFNIKFLRDQLKN